MELLFESRVNLSGFAGQLRFVQPEPEVHAEPVLRPDTFTDANGASYGSVLRDGAKLRMWYQAFPGNWDFQCDMAATAYAESDDGIHWTKPSLNLVPMGGRPNNLVNLGLGSPSVFIDPASPSSHRYRATGYGYKGLGMSHPDITAQGFYTAHSADGLDWKLDAAHPRWYSADVISSVYHPDQQRGIVALKYTARVGGIQRRSVHTAEYRDGRYSEAVSALYGDEFDDVCARNRGQATADYYGMGLQGAGSGTVGFLWNFWHAPGQDGSWHALYGTSDVTLVYQPDPGGRWFHVPGRPNFIAHTAHPWTNGWIHTLSGPVEIADEHRLYFVGTPMTHGFYLDSSRQVIAERLAWAQRHGQTAIGFARWPKWRLFGFEAVPEGAFTIDVGPVAEPSELVLNYRTQSGGTITAEIPDMEGRAIAQAVPLTGDRMNGTVAWTSGAVIPPSEGKRVSVRVHLARATLYAYELKTRI